MEVRILNKYSLGLIRFKIVGLVARILNRPIVIATQKQSPRFSIEKCPCGHQCCQDYHLKGIGHFVQGSGFSKEDAELIVRLLNKYRGA